MKLVRWPTIPEAAQMMSIGLEKPIHRSTAWRHFVALQKAHPDREILRGHGSNGRRTGKLRVCPQALLEVLHRDREDLLERLEDKVDSMESDVGSMATSMELIRIRLRRLEIAEKTRRKADSENELDRRLVARGCASLQKVPPVRVPRKQRSNSH